MVTGRTAFFLHSSGPIRFLHGSLGRKSLQYLLHLLPPILASLLGWSFPVSSQLKGSWLQSTNRMKSLSTKRLEKMDDKFSELKSEQCSCRARLISILLLRIVIRVRAFSSWVENSLNPPDRCSWRTTWETASVRATINRGYEQFKAPSCRRVTLAQSTPLKVRRLCFN